MSSNKNKLNILAYGVAVGLCWGLIITMTAIAALVTDGIDSPSIIGIGEMYIAFNTSLQGVAMGIAWALVDGFVAGVIVAFIYNVVLYSFCRSKSCT